MNVIINEKRLKLQNTNTLNCEISIFILDGPKVN